MKLFSYKSRPVHLGPYPLERLPRTSLVPDLSGLPPMQPLSFADETNPESLSNAMARFIGMFDTIRDGAVAKLKAEIPDDPVERSDHLKAASYYFDASQAAICEISPDDFLDAPIRNPGLDALAEELAKGQPKSYAPGIDLIYSDVLDASRSKPGPIRHHRNALVVLVEFVRDPSPEEPGSDWIVGTQAQRAAVLAAQTAVVLSNYIRLLGFEARAHTATTSDVHLEKLAVRAGLARVALAGTSIAIENPFLGKRFGLAAVTTTMELATDKPLGRDSVFSRLKSHGPAWWVGWRTAKSAFNRDPYRRREFRQGAFPFEKLKRKEVPTTFIDSARVPRFPKRADFFARCIFGDLGKNVQESAKNGMYILKSPIGYCARRALGALLLLQFGDARGPVSSSVSDPVRNADNAKAASYYLSSDAVGISAAPSWVYYSHDAGGNELTPYHTNAVTILIDQGHETMEGASGDDWISVAQSMRAYLRFSLLGGILGEQFRRLGYSARVHSVLDGDVLQPPLLLLSGLGEVSRIGEVILNPYLGPRLKSGVVTTDMPMTHDKPIDFGLQRFCESCNKCARECPSGAITAGPKLMYNGYEIWKSDAEKCARYRITNQGGGMCGRCMKTCPWNLEGLFAEAGFRWVAMKVPWLAKALARLDDMLNRGSINPVKKWWWDVELNPKSMQYVRAKATHRRGLNKQLHLKYEDQTLAVYPADVMPPPFPVVSPIDREAGIARYRNLLTPNEYKKRLASGETENLVPQFRMPDGPPPVLPVLLKRRKDMTPDVVEFEFVSADDKPLPPFEAGAHIDVIIAPEYQRQYSLAGDPSDHTKYVLGVQREVEGKGGSMLMHRAFREGRRVLVSPPRNHFPLDEASPRSFMFAGGIGVTPLITMAHRLHALGKEFELHYSVRSRATAGFLEELATVPWADRVILHIKEESGRIDLQRAIPSFEEGWRLYTCGSGRYMDSVFEAAQTAGWPDEALLREYFTVPEASDYVNYPFKLKLARSGRVLDVPADRTAADVLQDAGIAVDTKCSDGICGVCACKYTAGEVDHRDYVLSAKQRETTIILCSSRALEANGEITIDL